MNGDSQTPSSNEKRKSILGVQRTPPAGSAVSSTPKKAPPKKGKTSFKDELKSFFWIILVVLCIRAFIVEPYKIPTASMVPTLLVGDHIFVKKYAYAIGVPFTKIKLFNTGSVKRGDVAVFLYPEDESINFVKRIIALPGDTVEIRNRLVYVNNHPLNMEEIPAEGVLDEAIAQNKNPFQRLYYESYPNGPEGFDKFNTNFNNRFMLLDDLNRNPLTTYFEKTI